MMAARARDVDRIDPLPDDKIKEEDQRYVIDCISLDYELATQDPKTGLSIYRKRKLMELFRLFDKEGTGKISFRMLQDYSNQYGGTTLSYAELSSIFKDFQSGSDDVTISEFLVFWSRASRAKTNQEFVKMVEEMAA